MMGRLTTLAAIVAATTLLEGCVPAAVVATGAAVAMATDRRTTGIYVEDENIELKALALLHDGAFKDVHVNTTSFNRRVLLTGEAPTEELRKKVESAIRGISSVRDVQDEIQIAGASSLASRGNDSLITTNVKARMVNNGKFSPNHVKVVTEAGTVYLMGLVTQPEGDAAADIARSTSGVARVVKVFEYIS
ncbi:MAG TPA: BON domain-containing protein [Usitatibacter sp.]|jgi:osmotically-inducible protein OsmY|nr:BON domain-containing protein [Usitatibacter sp.]